MRVFWSALLVIGLGLIGLSVYEARNGAPTLGSTTTEDGVGYPAPSPTPTARPSQF
jgi:hypothetical protein